MRTIKHLKAAKYNPRTITDAKLNKLTDSIHKFGDLSGVVFNVRTDTLVSGHQRVKTMQGKKTAIVTKKMKDKHGTVARGYIIVKGENGDINVPYREVDWDIITEKAANIAANAHGGSFDKEKLRLVLASIEKKSKFDLELTGLDPLTLKSLRIKDEEATTGKSGKSKNDGDGKTFKEFDANMETEHKCPRCSYTW